jgi:gamma-glutamyltranspeptidase/glutathione hydrolase
MDVNVEGGFAPAVLEELTRRGHRIVELKEGYMDFGSAQMIWKLDGGYLAASDPRRDGQAVGF